MSAELTREDQAETSALVQSGVLKAFEAVKKSGDENVHYEILRPDPAITDPAEETGKDWALVAHWSVQGHSKVAGALVKAIQKVLPDWKAQEEPTPCALMESECTLVTDNEGSCVIA